MLRIARRACALSAVPAGSRSLVLPVTRVWSNGARQWWEVEAGDIVPSIQMDAALGGKVNIAERCAEKTVVVVGLPSAASGESQVAGYLEKQKQLKDAGVDEVLVYSTEGGADIEALATRCSGSMVTVLVDERMHLTRSLGMSITYTDSRSKRYAMVVKDGMAKAVWISYTAGARTLPSPPLLHQTDAAYLYIQLYVAVRCLYAHFT